MALAAATLGEGVLGLEAIHNFNGAAMNSLGGFPRYNLDRITGLRSRAESDDFREPHRGRTGEQPYASAPRGKTVTYEGRVQGLSLETMRGAINGMVNAFADTNFPKWCTVTPHASRGGVSFFYLARSLSCDIDEEQLRSGRTAWPTPYERKFIASVRQLDSRYFGPQVASGAYADGSTHVVNNTGWAPADPYFTLTGPIDMSGCRMSRIGGADPRFLELADSPAWAAINAGKHLVVDFFNRRAFSPEVGGDFTSLLQFNSTWWDDQVAGLLPGAQDVKVTGELGLDCLVQPGLLVMQLKARFTDLSGEPIAHLLQYTDLEVNDPLNDSRTARLTIRLDNPAVVHVKPLETMLKIEYGDFLIFWGFLVKPSFDFASRTVVVDAHDPTLRLKHHYHRFGDYAVDEGYPIDGRGMKILVESAIPLESQLEYGTKDLGILWGVNSTTEQGPKPNTDPPEAGDGMWRYAVRGMNVWESITNMSQTLPGPDFNFRPVDNGHFGVQGNPPDYFYCELDTADHLGEDSTSTAVFDYGWGRDTAENITFEPDGDTVRNWWAQVNPGGERSRSDEDSKAVKQNPESMMKYGIYQGWESSGQEDTNKVLEAKALMYVKAYAEPTRFFTVYPKLDSANVPLYQINFKTGDDILARAKAGYVSEEFTGRVIRTTIRQVDANGNTKMELECVPIIDLTAEDDEWAD